jgi:hypothetical protein
VSKAVVSELVGRFGARFSPDEIEECVNEAARDLLGSISLESLPEMAIRLAVVRLSRRPRIGDR